MMEITDAQLVEFGFWNTKNFNRTSNEEYWILDICTNGVGIHYVPSRLMPWLLTYSNNVAQPLDIRNIEELKLMIRLLGGRRIL